MAASSLSGMDAKAQTQRDAVYHIQNMYRGLTVVGTLQGLCRDYKEAKAQSWKAAGVRGKPRVRSAGPLAPPPPPPKGTPTHAMNNAPCAMQSSVLSPLCLLLLHMYWLKSGTAVPAVAVKLHTVPPSTTLITGSSLRSPATPLQSPATPMTNSQQLPCNPHHLQ